MNRKKFGKDLEKRTRLIEKQIEPEVKRTSEIKYKFVKASQVKPNSGWR